MVDRLTPEQRKKNMIAVKSKGSKIELIFESLLLKSGFEYYKNYTKVFGTPDFVISKYNIAIFIDSEFWHGKNWGIRKYDHKSNKKFWIKKISKNIERDVLVNKILKKNGWAVLRFWGNDVIKNSNYCILKLITVINDKTV